jgi:histidyl-tRNA synthetase
MNMQTLKGFRDFLPQEARKRQYVIDIFKKVFESFGFEPLETPALEYEELLIGKYGQEGDKLMYRFEDQGKRRVAMRYDQTVPTARVVAQYQNILPMPFKRYQMQNVWRADNTQKGRYREFMQCDADTIGSFSPLADAEMLAMVYDTYEKLGLDVMIKVNDRTLLKEISSHALPILDKLNKIGEDNVLKELQQKGFSPERANNILKQVKSLKQSVQLQEILGLYALEKSQDSWKFDPTLIRGLDYYTGLIFEVVLKSNPNSPSLCGGGRYDHLIGIFAGKQIPAVGFAIGFDRTIEAMEEYRLFPQNILTSSTKIFVTIFNKELEKKSLEIVSKLRAHSINTEVYVGDIKEKNPLEKQFKYADQKDIPFVAIIGPEEEKKEIITIKNLQTREQKQVSFDELLNLLQNK